MYIFVFVVAWLVFKLKALSLIYYIYNVYIYISINIYIYIYKYHVNIHLRDWNLVDLSDLSTHLDASDLRGSDSDGQGESKLPGPYGGGWVGSYCNSDKGVQ